MGIIRSQDSKGHYYINLGLHPIFTPHKYYFNPTNRKSIDSAYKKARKQQKAMFQSGLTTYRGRTKKG